MQNLNITLIAFLSIVVVAFVLLYNRKKRTTSQKKNHEQFSSPSLGESFDKKDTLGDEGIIAVRKKEGLAANSESVLANKEEPVQLSKTGRQNQTQDLCVDESVKYAQFFEGLPILILHVMAKANTVFSGYELLQSLLGTGLRFGSMNIFHYYQASSSNEKALFSLASATEPGVFDIQNMGGFSCVGLTLFMQRTGNDAEDKSIYDLMFQTARHLSEDLDGMVLDREKNLLFPVQLSNNVVDEPLLVRE